MRPKIKLEPGLLQTLPSSQSALATPLKVEIQENYLDSGQSQPGQLSSSSQLVITDIEGALIIADSEEMSLTNMTLDYFINDNGTCTCKLCGEVTASRTHWYRHKYKVSKSQDVNCKIKYPLCRFTTFVYSNAKNARFSSRARKGTKATLLTDTRPG